MPTDDRATHIFRSPIIVVTVILAGVGPPSHADTDVFATSRRAGKVKSGTPIVTLSVAGGKDDFARVTCELLADDLDRNRAIERPEASAGDTVLDRPGIQ
jgi:hypothetical protein